MRHLVAALVLLALGCASPEEQAQMPAAGEACDVDGRCAEGLSCIRLVCADDRGPSFSVGYPEHLEAFEGEVTGLDFYFGVPVVIGDQIELLIDPGTVDEHRELLALEDDDDYQYVYASLSLPAPLAVGPHRLRMRVIDGDGQPYPNPSATHDVIVFVRDPDIPSTPQVAIVWPPFGHQHRLGNPLEVEVAVLPGSFTFVDDSDNCPPLPDCEPVFAPECENQCGPISRMGHAKLFSRPDYPDCLLDFPVGCNGDYIASMRPGSVDVIDGHQIRVVLPPERFTELGTVPLQAALSYSYHDPYPTADAVVHHSITLTLVE